MFFGDSCGREPPSVTCQAAWFTEAFDTADLEEAKALLDSLP